MRCVPIGTHLLLTYGISEERKFQTNVKDFRKMVIFDTVSMLFWGVFLTKDVRHETKEIVFRV